MKIKTTLEIKSSLDGINDCSLSNQIKRDNERWVTVDEILKDLEKIGKLIPFLKSETLQEERNVSIKVACEIRKLTKILKGERR